MAKQTADKNRTQRREARERRRSLAAEPFEQLDEAARSDDDASGGKSALKQTLGTAAAGAVAAGIAGAAKALRDRRADDDDGADDQDRSEEPQWGGDALSEESDASEPDPQLAAEEQDADEAGQRDEPEQSEEPRDEAPEGEAEQDGGDDGRRQSVSAGDAKKMVDNARRQLQEILGLEPESVSGFEADGDGWKVTLEVVEVRRIPDSTDVLSSYEVTLDEDGNVAGASQRRRYRRSQVEEG